MKRIITSAAMLMSTLLAIAQFSGQGSGTSTDPYLITTASELDEVRQFTGNTSVHFKLAKSIDLTQWISSNSANEGWEPIGTTTSTFQGTFDGNGKTIKGLFINRPNTNYVGLFGYLRGGTIKNLMITDCYVTGCSSVGSLLGKMDYSSTVNACGATGTVIGTGATVGGLVGAEDGSPSNSWHPVISNCFFNGTVEAGDGSTDDSFYADAGGLLGYCFKATVTKCYAAGTVRSSKNVGGVMGSYTNSGLKTQGAVSYCVAANTDLWGCHWTGRIMGEYSAVSYTSNGNKAYSGMNIYFRGSSTPRDNVYDGCNSTNGTDNGTGVSMDALMRKTTYTSMGWDFVNTWTIDEGASFPRLITSVEKEDQTLTFETTVTMHIGETLSLPTSTDQGLPLLWSIDENDIASLDGCTVTAMAEGSATLTATQVGNDSYNSFSWSCTLIVEQASLGDNRLVLTNLTATSGTQAILPIGLKNDDGITAFQVLLTLPEGVAVTSKILSERASDHSATISNQGNGTWLITVFSSSNAIFNGNEGNVMSLTLDIPSEMEAGTYTISLTEAELSTPDMETANPSDTSATLEIANWLLGDVNGDGKVNILDVVALNNHLHGNEPPVFISQAADVNGSGTITITDAVGIINIIHSGTSANATNILDDENIPQ